jgi:hypothetical protein
LRPCLKRDLATKAGVNPDLVYQAIRGGLAGSTVLDAKAPMVMDRNFKPGFRIDLHIKDLANALDTSHGVGAQLPLTAAVMEMMQALRADGLVPPTTARLRATTKNWRKWKSLANKKGADSALYSCLARHCQANNYENRNRPRLI